jgi:hypothetical protein
MSNDTKLILAAIKALENKFTGLDGKFVGLDQRLTRLEVLYEDISDTIKVDSELLRNYLGFSDQVKDHESRIAVLEQNDRLLQATKKYA